MYEYVCMYVYGNLPEQKIRFWSYPNFRGSILRYPQDSFEKIYFFPPPQIIFVKTKNFLVNYKIIFQINYKKYLGKLK